MRKGQLIKKVLKAYKDHIKYKISRVKAKTENGPRFIYFATYEKK